MRILAVLLSFYIVSGDHLPQAMTEDPEGETTENVQTNKTEEPPSMYLIEPYPRNGTESANSSIYPCGGLPKGKTHLLITPGSYSIIQWKTVKSAPEGKCLIQVGHGIGKEPTFVTLHPRDKSSNSAGYFACGRYSGIYESKEFGFPSNLSCDVCILQLTWETPEFKQYYCADITIMSNEIKYCMGSCLNGGSCVNGNCVCEEYYYGKFCEHKEKTSIPIGKIWILHILLLALIIVLSFAIYMTWPQDDKGRQHFIERRRKGDIKDIAKELADRNNAGRNRDSHGDYQNEDEKWRNEHEALFEDESKSKDEGAPFGKGEEPEEDPTPGPKVKHGGKLFKTQIGSPESQYQQDSHKDKADSEVIKEDQKNEEEKDDEENESLGGLKQDLGKGLMHDLP